MVKKFEKIAIGLTVFLLLNFASLIILQVNEVKAPSGVPLMFASAEHQRRV